jgi:ribosomal protein S18 acetylase RimI-like enzyme
MTCLIRELDSSDQTVLWDFLYEALWDPPGKPRRPRSVLDDPFIAVYVQNWKSNQSDLGFVAVSADGSVAGIVCSRILVPPLQGGAFYDDRTPQLGIAVFPPFQNQGIGTALLARHLELAATRFCRISLGVHPENYVAIGLYRRFGFYQFAVGKGGYLNMVKDL